MRQGNRIVAALGLALCGILFAVALRSNDPLPGANAEASRKPPAERAGSFPRRAIDAAGREIVIESAPRAVGSHAITIDHFLFAISDLDRLAVVSPYVTDPSYSFVPEVAADLSLPSTSDLEAVLRADPDLMLLAERAKADYEDLLRQVGIPTFRLRTVFSDFGQIADEIALAGLVTGNDSAARREVGRLRKRIERAKRRRPPNAAALRVLAYSTHGTTLGRGSLFDHILAELGEINVASEQGIGEYATISSEQLAAWDPDWIVAPAARGSAEQVRGRLLADVGIAVTRAGRSGQVLIVESRLFTAMSHHAVGLMEAIAAGLYAEGT